ncbi:MAG: RidA family protein [Opitutales bacterium]|nr:RidA family protein [Opitutales bacterium]
MDQFEKKLSAMGYTLPPPPAPGGNYLPFRRSGKTIYLAGVIAVQNGQMTHTGQVGAGQTVETGYAAARVCALNALAAIKLALGSLDEMAQILFLGGYVNAVSGFAESPQVINGASDFLVELFGERGQHARAAVAVAGLPKDSTVELQLIVEALPFEKGTSVSKPVRMP